MIFLTYDYIFVATLQQKMYHHDMTFKTMPKTKNCCCAKNNFVPNNKV